MEIKLIIDMIVSKIKKLAKLHIRDILYHKSSLLVLDSRVPIFFLLFYTDLAQFLAKVFHGIMIILNWFEPLLPSLYTHPYAKKQNNTINIDSCKPPIIFKQWLKANVADRSKIMPILNKVGWTIPFYIHPLMLLRSKLNP